MVQSLHKYWIDTDGLILHQLSLSAIKSTIFSKLQPTCQDRTGKEITVIAVLQTGSHHFVLFVLMLPFCVSYAMLASIRDQCLWL
jgi:hypothetical protein